MANGIGTVQVKRNHGELVVQGLGQTPRGQKFIRDTKRLGVKSSTDPQFKAKLKAAVEQMLAQEALPL